MPGTALSLRDYGTVSSGRERGPLRNTRRCDPLEAASSEQRSRRKRRVLSLRMPAAIARLASLLNGATRLYTLFDSRLRSDL